MTTHTSEQCFISDGIQVKGVREDDVMMILVHPETAHPSSIGIFPSLCHSSATNRE